jgi:Ca-activated chloride channel family protein
VKAAATVALLLVVTSGAPDFPGVSISRASERVLGQRPIRVGIDLVHFGIVVTDRRGAPISGLTVDDFEVLERGKPQQVKFFAAGDAEPTLPLHLGFLLDASGSMEQDIRDVRTAAIKFLNQTEQAVDVTLVDFDTEVRVARYAADDFPTLIERIRMRKPGGYTAFYDALGIYLHRASSQTGQKILVVYTDGGDTRSTINAKDVTDLLKASDVTLYSLGYLQHQSSSVRASSQMELQRFAEMTGGQAFFPTSTKELDGLYEKILKEIAGRYTLGYTSSDERADGTWRPVEIKLKRQDLKGTKIRTRPGYYAAGTPGAPPAR